jgi:hypothetical protein
MADQKTNSFKDEAGAGRFEERLTLILILQC